MAAGWPTKANYATGDVLSATNMNDLSGTVNLINPSAKGDLYAGSAANTYTKLSVGANNTVLTADSSTATGLKWATPTATGFVGCSIAKSASQSIPNATETLITFDVENIDTDSFHSTVTNTSRITIPAGKAGKYLVTGQVMPNTSGSQTQGGLRKNGTGIYTYYSPTSGAALQVIVNNVFDLAVGDYLEMFVYQGSGSAKDVLSNAYTANASLFSVTYLGA